MVAVTCKRETRLLCRNISIGGENLFLLNQNVAGSVTRMRQSSNDTISCQINMAISGTVIPFIL